MTYGKIRALLRQKDTSLPMERLDLAIQNGLEAILGRHPWRALRGETVVSTIAKYVTGTLAATNGSATITGTGTAWTDAMTGRKIRIGSDTQYYTFTRVSATEGALDRAYEGTTGTGLTYRLFQNLITFGEDVGAIRSVNYPRQLPLRLTSLAWIHSQDPARTSYGDPLFFSSHYNTDPAAPPSVIAIELWPSPEEAWPVQIEFRRVVTGFDGTNTNDSPPAWVSAGAIHALAEYELFADPASLTRATTLIDGMYQTEIEGQVGGVRIPRDPRYTPRHSSGSWPRNPGADTWARSD